MKGLTFCLFTIMMLMSAQGEEEEPLEQLMNAEGLEEKEELLQCFRCDLGFWDACYTTETNCSLGERCFTGRGKAADVLDVKTLGCAKAEECNVETTVELFSNNTIFVMNKDCCDTSFCNSAFKLQADTLFCITVVFMLSWHFAGASTH
ncbi:sperm acrosome membrane-associated protein 4-like [Dunckerocampus dactyliophorus]|uniref:sperm acrosome membrane-associated protein 4-like n=1 Tax=Dunckerocampus dactyliophorus TaxID=161453 RepID=UPI00240665CC|nr:sperm acrosome membrane-associated protein 4-like [Dunckerocampus dactyliophorus]